MPKLKLSDDAARLLVDVIDMHVQSVTEAKCLTEVDPTVDSAEQLLDLMSGYDSDMAILKEIRECLHDSRT